MGNNYWFEKITDLFFLLVLGVLAFISRYAWGRSAKAYTILNDKSFNDRFNEQNKENVRRIELLEEYAKQCAEDKRTKEAIAKAIEDLKYKNGL
jgi:hypothetical protein